MSQSNSHEGSIRAIAFAFLANLGIALTKLVAAILTGSGSMLAEAIHSSTDCINQVLLYIGMKRSSRPADARHPLGYGKVVYFWSFIVAILLFSMGGIVSVYEGVHKLQNPEPLSHAWVGLAVIAVSAALEGGSLFGALREVRRLSGKTPLLKWVATSRRAELIVVLGEDVAALAGLLLAGLFLSLSAVTGNPFFDAMGSVVIGVLLLLISIGLSMRIQSMLVGESADPEIEQTIREHIIKDPAIESLLNLITMQFGPDIVVACKVGLCQGLSIAEGIEAINTMERSLKEQIPEVRWSFVEIDRED